MSARLGSRWLRRRTTPPILAAAGAFVAIFIVGYVLMRSSTPERLAFYDRGSATLSIDRRGPQALGLDPRGATLWTAHGATLDFADSGGLSLSLTGPFPGDSGATTEAHGHLIREDGGAARNIGGWAGFDSTVCAIAYDDVTSARIAGSIHCRGLVWYEAAGERPRPLELPPFDLDGTFEATGSRVLPTSTP